EPDDGQTLQAQPGRGGCPIASAPQDQAQGRRANASESRLSGRGGPASGQGDRGGALVVTFKPKMFAGLFGAAPSLATASLLVNGLALGRRRMRITRP